MIEIHYRLVAAPSQAGSLGIALLALAAAIGGQPGCRNVRVLQDIGDQARFVFIEQWETAEAQEAAGRAIGREAFTPVLALSRAKPERSVMRPYPT